MSSQQEVDELFDIKNSYYIGNYQKCINEAQTIELSKPDSALERDIFLYRALIAQGMCGVVLIELKDKSSPLLQSVKLFARYHQSSERTSAMNEMEEKLKDGVSVDDYMLLIVAAAIYCDQRNFEAALRVLNQSDELECRALMVQTYLKIYRIDAAKKELKVLQEKDDDATLTQLAQAWIHIAEGREKLQDAYYIYQELIDKNTPTPLLLNGLAVCFMGQGQHEEAECALQEALVKDPKNADTIINIMILFQVTNKPPNMAKRYLAQLNEDHKENHFVQDMNAKEEEFDRISKMYK